MTTATSTASTTTTTNTTRQPTKEEIVSHFRAMRAELQRMAEKMGDLELEKEEHRLVIDTMTPVAKDRKAFRLLNGVLVEKTVGDVLPTLQSNMSNLGVVMEKLAETFKEKEKQMLDFQKLYQIRIEGQPE